MARNPQVKLAITPHHREVLEWIADVRGVAPATQAGLLLRAAIDGLLDDPEIRRAWAHRTRRRALEELEGDIEGEDLATGALARAEGLARHAR